MDKFMDRLQAFLASDEAKRCAYDDISPVEMLYEFYAHQSPPETQALCSHRDRVERLTAHLSYRERNAILCAVNELCAEQEKFAMIEGIRLGARTILALTDTTSPLGSPYRDKGQDLDCMQKKGKSLPG